MNNSPPPPDRSHTELGHRQWDGPHGRTVFSANQMCSLSPTNAQKRFSRLSCAIILRGEGDIRWDCAPEQGRPSPLSVSPGWVFIQRPGVWHSIRRYKPESWVQVSIGCDEDTYRQCEQWGIIDTLGPDPDAWLLAEPESLVAMLDEFRLMLRSRQPVAQGVIAQHAQGVFRALFSSRNQAGGESTLWLEEAQALLKECGPSRRGIKDIARTLGMNYHVFRRRFQQACGVSPHQYRLHDRIRQAQVLLEESILSMADIAHHLGFGDSFAFSKQFKQHVGQSPSRYRAARL